MSEENVEVARRGYDAYNREGPYAIIEYLDPEVEWYEAWETVQDDFDQLIDAGEHVIGVVTNRGRGRASGAEVELTQHLIWTIREGKIFRVVFFPSRDEALEAAGLSG